MKLVFIYKTYINKCCFPTNMYIKGWFYIVFNFHVYILYIFFSLYKQKQLNICDFVLSLTHLNNFQKTFEIFKMRKA